MTDKKAKKVPLPGFQDHATATVRELRVDLKWARNHPFYFTQRFVNFCEDNCSDELEMTVDTSRKGFFVMRAENRTPNHD